jgi:hypothetical protein
LRLLQSFGAAEQFILLRNVLVKATNCCNSSIFIVALAEDVNEVFNDVTTAMLWKKVSSSISNTFVDEREMVLASKESNTVNEHINSLLSVKSPAGNLLVA